MRGRDAAIGDGIFWTPDRVVLAGLGMLITTGVVFEYYLETYPIQVPHTWNFWTPGDHSNTPDVRTPGFAPQHVPNDMNILQSSGNDEERAFIKSGLIKMGYLKGNTVWGTATPAFIDEARDAIYKIRGGANRDQIMHKLSPGAEAIFGVAKDMASQGVDLVVTDKSLNDILVIHRIDVLEPPTTTRH